MKKIYHLGTCTTCQRILKEWQPLKGVELQEIKTEPITVKQLAEMQKMSGSYESLFSRRAMLYKERNLASKSLTENDYKNLILEHYTFLKRPVAIIDGQVFIGNAKKEVEMAKKALHS